MDTGDFVIVVNAEKLILTGKKLDQKYYYRHSGYPGGLKQTKYRDLMQTKPELAFYEAVRRMLPKKRFGQKDAYQAARLQRRGAQTCSAEARTAGNCKEVGKNGERNNF